MSGRNRIAFGKIVDGAVHGSRPGGIDGIKADGDAVLQRIPASETVVASSPARSSAGHALHAVAHAS